MNNWAVAFLGVIAVATAATAVLQIVLIVYGVRLVQRVTMRVDDFERELKPLLTTVNAVGRDAARATTLMVAQVERMDELFTDVTNRVSATVAAVHQTITGPAREWPAVLVGLRAAAAILRGLRGAVEEKGKEDDETLFI